MRKLLFLCKKVLKKINFTSFWDLSYFEEIFIYFEDIQNFIK